MSLAGLLAAGAGIALSGIVADSYAVVWFVVGAFGLSGSGYLMIPAVVFGLVYVLATWSVAYVGTSTFISLYSIQRFDVTTGFASSVPGTCSRLSPRPRSCLPRRR